MSENGESPSGNGAEVPLEVKALRDASAADQLTQTVTPFTNRVMHAPPGQEEEVGDLAVELAVDPLHRSVVTVSAWELDERQRRLVAAGAHLRMSVWQHPIPPLALAIEAPFCGNCGGVTIYVKGESRFACPGCGERIDPDAGNAPKIALPPGAERKTSADDRATSRAALEQAKRDFVPTDDDPQTPDERRE